MILLPPRDALSPLERFGLDVLIDLSRCPPLEDGTAEAVRLVLEEQGTAPVALRDFVERDWTIRPGDGIVRVARAALHRIAEVTTAAAERASPTRDRFGRVPSAANALVREGLTADPIVSRAGIVLRRAIAASAGRRPVAVLDAWPAGKRWAAAVTHDLDVVDRWPVFTALRLVELARKGQLRRLARTVGAAVAAIGGRPVQRALEQLLEAERGRDIVSTWFVLCGTPTLRSMRAGDLTYRPEGAGARRLLDELVQRGCEINLHGSFATSEQHTLFAEQRSRLAGLTGQPVEGVRQHFLRMQPGHTMRGMAAAGFRYDTSFGFPDRNGFRLGVADVVRTWDGNADQPLDLEEAPVTWMDRALSKYAGVEDPQAWIADGVTLAETCRAVDGLWVGVWHPNLTPALGFPDAPAAFDALLGRLRALDPCMAPLSELVQWRTARRSVRVRGVRADGTPDGYASAPGPDGLTVDVGGRRHHIPRSTGPRSSPN